MKILFFGDIYGKTGRRALATVLPKLRQQYQPDFVLANAENLAHGRGPGEKQLTELAALGVDGFTSGNHIFDSSEGIEILEKTSFPLTRPANYPRGTVGNPYIVLQKNKTKLLVSNALGRIFMGDPLDSPFVAIDTIIKIARKLKIKHTFVDFHAEATSEKTAFGFYFDGRVSAIIGTHTHVQTSDARILPGGSAYISDAGFCGSLDSVIGARTECALKRFLTNLPAKLEVAENAPFVVSGVALELYANGKAKSIERIYEVIDQ